MADRKKKRADGATPNPARVEEARRMREALVALPWGPKPERDYDTEVRAFYHAYAEYIEARVAHQRTAQRHERSQTVCDALDRYDSAKYGLAAVAGHRIAWVTQVAFTVIHSERATDPVACAELDDMMRSHWQSLYHFQMYERGRQEGREEFTGPLRDGAYRGAAQRRENQGDWRGFVDDHPGCSAGEIHAMLKGMPQPLRQERGLYVVPSKRSIQRYRETKAAKESATVATD